MILWVLHISGVNDARLDVTVELRAPRKAPDKLRVGSLEKQ